MQKEEMHAKEIGILSDNKDDYFYFTPKCPKDKRSWVNGKPPQTLQPRNLIWLINSAVKIANTT